ncbi:MAG: hypothetical protein ACWGSQ_15360 [Longimicrobiales bacterium]
MVVLLLTGLVVQGGWTVLATLRKAGEETAETAEGLETVRTAAWLLEEELGGSLPLRDWWAGEGDSVSLRAYRGLALVTGTEAGGGTEVCYRGIRNPNPDKDSILFLTDGGSWRAHALTGRSRGERGCLGDGEGWEEVWEVEPPSDGALLGRVYERGSYHLALGALRYRRGGGGRQPLTPPRIAEGSLEAGEGAHGGLRWTLFLSDPEKDRDTLAWSGRIR